MEQSVIVAFISFLGTLIGTLGGIIASSKLTTYRIQQLEKKVEQHNKVVERVYILERDKAVFEKELKVANHRIDDLEQHEHQN